MRKFALLCLIVFVAQACKSKRTITDPVKKVKTQTSKTAILKNESAYIIENIINKAQEYNGVRYKYGGTTEKGMDCSGLIYTAFKEENIRLPRISKEMAKRGIEIPLDDVQKGDLLFFQTNKNRTVINHVGLVVASRTGNIEFIHATTSAGVIISSLAERYWYYSFKEARRVL